MQVKGTTHEFASVFCKNYLVSGQLEANFDQDLLRGNFDIVGQSEYTVSLLRDDQEVLTHVPLENGQFSQQTALENGEYTAVIYEAFSDVFGFETIYDEIGRIKTK